MSVISATEAAIRTMEQFAQTLRAVQATASLGSAASDQARADYRRRLQDPLEIEALKRRLGLR